MTWKQFIHLLTSTVSESAFFPSLQTTWGLLLLAETRRETEVVRFAIVVWPLQAMTFLCGPWSIVKIHEDHWRIHVPTRSIRRAKNMTLQVGIDLAIYSATGILLASELVSWCFMGISSFLHLEHLRPDWDSIDGGFGHGRGSSECWLVHSRATIFPCFREDPFFNWRH